ncbi:MAG: polysaccharide export protein [Nitrospirales bacterium]|nr:polysaccharide export protein [Nitrospirales bacterium]MDR4483507.1 polysaccharide export protein [Nitrospirales bacterium]
MKDYYAHVIVRGWLLVSIIVGLGCFKPDVIVPAGHPVEGFVLGPEDVIEVVVWKTPELSRKVVIRPDGKISMALIGDVVASGLTTDQLAQKILEKYKAFKENPSVSVNVIEVNSYYVFIVGEVEKPGKLPLKSYTTVLQAMSLAGGFSQFASRDNILVIRNVEDEEGKLKEIRIPLRYSDLISEDGGMYNLTLKSGDTVIVP